MEEFTFNDMEQTIMGVHIKECCEYHAVKNATLFNVYEGWKPTKNDIEKLIEYSPSNDKKMLHDYQRIYGGYYEK